MVRRASAGAAALAALLPAPAFAQSTGTSLQALALVIVAGAVIVVAAALVLGLTMTISARRALKANALRMGELQDAVGRLSAMLDHAPDGYFAWAAGSGLETYSPALVASLNAPAVSTRSFRDLSHLLVADDYTSLETAAATLREDRIGFDGEVRARNGRVLTVRGRLVKGQSGDPLAYVIWFFDATARHGRQSQVEADLREAGRQRDQLQEILDVAPFPTWRRTPDLGIAWVNQAYCEAVETDPATAVAKGIEFVPGTGPQQSRSLAALARETGRPQTDQRRFNVGGDRRVFEITEAPLDAGATAGYARDVTEREDAWHELRRHADAQETVMDLLPSAIVIFGPDKRARFANEAFAKLWGLDSDWLDAKPTHGEILEALREARRLPEQADFRAYKASVLGLYSSVLTPEEENLHLPDGRTLRVATAPHPFGGLVFIYDDISSRLELERSRNTLEAVQKATLDNLFEGVAVYGADGRLKLFNPGFARIWKLDQAFLATQPHVTDVAERCRALFAHAPGEWLPLRDRIVARTLERTGRVERLERPDGRVVEFASVPLPDGNSLYTYFDVTEGTRLGPHQLGS